MKQKELKIWSVVRLNQQGNPDEFPNGIKNLFTIAGIEKRNGLTFYRVKELSGALFLRESFADPSSPAEIRKGERPCIAYEANDFGYSAEDADILFAKLEARIAELEGKQ